jgi:hypothetical protein
MSLNDNSRITDEQQLAILAAMDWDCKSAAWPIVMRWLELAKAEALVTVELNYGKMVTDEMREALEKAEWARDFVPGYGPKGKLETA